MLVAYKMRIAQSEHSSPQLIHTPANTCLNMAVLAQLGFEKLNSGSRQVMGGVCGCQHNNGKAFCS